LVAAGEPWSAVAELPPCVASSRDGTKKEKAREDSLAKAVAGADYRLKTLL